MRKSVIVAAVIAAGAVAWLASGALVDSAAPGGQTGRADTPAREARFQVRVADLVAEPYVEEVSLLGHTRAARTVQIATEIDGRVAEVLVEEGARVAAGQPIVRLEVNDLVARVEEAEALVEQRRIEYNAAQQLGQSGYSARTQVASAL